MLVAVAVLAVILTVISTILFEITQVWKGVSGTAEGFQDARVAFEAMTRTISQATLNTYYDYIDTNGNFRTPANSTTFIPSTYGRQSDLQFISGPATKTLLSSVSQIQNPLSHSIFFQAPLGITDNVNYGTLNNTLNACGFFLVYGTDPAIPTFLSSTSVPNLRRCRLMQFTEPTEYLSIYDAQTGAPLAPGTSPSIYNLWFLGPLGATSPTSISQLAENVVALILLPELSPSDQAANPTTVLAPNYGYDSRDSTTPTTYNQLPPMVDLTMVAIDEASAVKLGNTAAVPTNFGLSGLFTDSSKLTSDLQTLEQNLSATSGNAAGNHIPLHFRVFHSSVAIQSAKWSK